MNCTNNGGPPPVLYWAILRIVQEEKWEVDLEEDETDLMSNNLDECVEKGYFGKAIIEYRCGREFGKNIMNNAAGCGHLDMVKWLHENHMECDIRAMDLAAENGHLHMVQWLHENRTEGCSIWAMNAAAMNGYLDVVIWLHENRTEECSIDTMNGHLDVTRWLHENQNKYGNECHWYERTSKYDCMII